MNLRKIIPCVLIIFAFVVSIGFAYGLGVSLGAGSGEIAWDTINTSLALLEVYIVVASIGLAAIGFFGYEGIKKELQIKVISDTNNVLKDMQKNIKKIITDEMEARSADIEKNASESFLHVLEQMSENSGLKNKISKEE